MAGERGTRRDRDRRRALGVVGASVVVHLLVLATLGFSVPRRYDPIVAEPPPLAVILIPRTEPFRTHSLRAKTTQAATAPAASAQAPAAPPPPIKPHVVPPPIPSAASPVPLPGPLAPTPTEAAHGTSIAPGPLPYEDSGRGVRAMLRGTAGCSFVATARLTEEEKARCIQRFGEAAKKAAPFSGIPEEKRAYYDAVQKRYQTMHSNEAPVSLVARGALGVFEDESRVIGGQMVGHGPAIGCGLKFGAGAGKKDTRSQSDRIKQDGMASIDIGPLKCGVVIPQGSLTPEIGIPQP